MNDIHRTQPTSLAAALETLARSQRPVVVAGGTDLVVQSRGGGEAQSWCDIGRIAELHGITREDGPAGDTLRIGALATWSELVASVPVREHLPLLVEAALTVGAPAIRNRGTLGGNVVNASPAGDGLPVLLVHDVQVELASRDGRRRIAIADFWLDYRQTARRPDELLVAIHVPLTTDGEKPDLQAFRKVGPRQAQAIAKLSLAARLWRRSDGSLRARLAMGAVAAVPLRCRQTEDHLGTRPFELATVATAAACLRGEIAPIDDLRSTAVYRRRVAERMLSALLQNLLDEER